MPQSSSTSEEEQYFPEYGSLGMREISVLPDLWVDLYVIKHELSPAPHLYAENSFIRHSAKISWYDTLISYGL